MPISLDELNSAVGQTYRSATFSKSLSESIKTASSKEAEEYDIFLSHSYLDKEVVFKINSLFEDIFRLSVFVDWIEGEHLVRADVDSDTANFIRSAMKRSKCLIYAFSPNSTNSKWMPWELGFSDAFHGRVAILPVTDDPSIVYSGKGQEYLELYPFVNYNYNTTMTGKYLWVHDQSDWEVYNFLDMWKSGYGLYKHNP